MAPTAHSPTAEPQQRLQLVKPPAGAVLRAEGLQKRYRKRTVVHDVSLTVESGEVVGLLGPNGAGKTTCFYMIVGLVPVDGGEHPARRAGRHPPADPPPRAAGAVLPAAGSVDLPRLTVAREHPGRAGTAGPIPTRISNPGWTTCCDDLHIAHLRDNPAISLSGGERRRVEIARALATDPRFILLDEPFAGVDPIAVLDIQKIIRFLKERGIGVLITDHNVRETLGICDRAYIINDGRCSPTASRRKSSIMRTCEKCIWASTSGCSVRRACSPDVSHR